METKKMMMIIPYVLFSLSCVDWCNDDRIQYTLHEYRFPTVLFTHTERDPSRRVPPLSLVDVDHDTQDQTDRQTTSPCQLAELSCTIVQSENLKSVNLSRACVRVCRSCERVCSVLRNFMMFGVEGESWQRANHALSILCSSKSVEDDENGLPWQCAKWSDGPKHASGWCLLHSGPYQKVWIEWCYPKRV